MTKYFKVFKETLEFFSRLPRPILLLPGIQSAPGLEVYGLSWHSHRNNFWQLVKPQTNVCRVTLFIISTFGESGNKHTWKRRLGC